MEGNVKVHVESRTRLPDMEDVLHFRGSGTLEITDCPGFFFFIES